MDKFLKTKGIIFSVVFLLFSHISFAQEDKGKALFISKCASCHAINKDLTGPALQGIEERVPDKKLLYAWIRNNQKVLATGNEYFNDLYLQWNKTQMNIYEELSDDDIGDILVYINNWKPAVKAVASGGDVAGSGSPYERYLIGGIAIILAIVSIVLMMVNSTLKKVADEKLGLKPLPKVSLFRRKSFWLILAIALTVFGTYDMANSAINLGRNTNYMPEQPIYYSHKVHAGVNQINCVYCHTGAEKSKHANIPSVNVCMNCHMAINEYNGEPLIASNGEEIDGTAEIQKLYAYAGWDPKTKQYNTDEATPIAWIRIHNLPDNVYFNHAQHVSVGKVHCNTCHGQISEMDEVYQYSSLGMGWCVNCHRETEVQFGDNDFYTMYKTYHQEYKEGKLDKVTVEQIGGTQCQKCHY